MNTATFKNDSTFINKKKSHQPAKRFYNLEETDKHLLELAKPRPKNCTCFCTFPVMIDSASEYYKTDWLTEYEYWTLRERFGNSVQLLNRMSGK